MNRHVWKFFVSKLVLLVAVGGQKITPCVGCGTVFGTAVGVRGIALLGLKVLICFVGVGGAPRFVGPGEGFRFVGETVWPRFVGAAEAPR